MKEVLKFKQIEIGSHINPLLPDMRLYSESDITIGILRRVLPTERGVYGVINPSNRFNKRHHIGDLRTLPILLQRSLSGGDRKLFISRSTGVLLVGGETVGLFLHAPSP